MKYKDCNNVEHVSLSLLSLSSLVIDCIYPLFFFLISTIFPRNLKSLYTLNHERTRSEMCVTAGCVYRDRERERGGGREEKREEKKKKKRKRKREKSIHQSSDNETQNECVYILFFVFFFIYFFSLTDCDCSRLVLHRSSYSCTEIR